MALPLTLSTGKEVAIGRGNFSIEAGRSAIISRARKDTGGGEEGVGV